MSDPYLDFNDKNDLSNIQVNVFHVKDTLRGIPVDDRSNILHNNCYIFNPIDSKNPSIPNIKCKPKVVKNTIYYVLQIQVQILSITANIIKTNFINIQSS